MKESNIGFTWRMMILAFLLPPLLILAIDMTFFDDFKPIDSGVSFARFTNATLTAYTLCSLFLLGNLFFYGESRNRPWAPLVGMVMATALGVLATVFFIGQGSMLLEDNGSVRAQAIYNIVHMFVSSGAILMAFSVALGVTFSAITSQKQRNNFELEEE
jgi:lipoprotein signal peptidase